jgi:hypothetical protein
MATAKLVELDKEALFRALAFEPHEGQWAVHRSKAPRRILCTGVRWGKTKAAGMEALAAAMEPKKSSVGWVVAPTYDLAERVYREIVVCAAEHLRHRIITLRESDKRLVLRNLGGGTSEIRAKSADNPVSLLGEGLDWLVIDEAARLKPVIWESHLSQRLIDKKGWMLATSTPRGKGWLHSLWQRGQTGSDPAFASWSFPSWNNPRLDRALIDAERERLPERVFAQEYGGEFIEGSGAVLRYVREAATGTLREPVPGETYFAGLDLARVADYSVITVVTGSCEVVHVDRFNRIDWGLQVARIRAATKRYNDAWVYVDATGIGAPLMEALQLADVRAEPYTMTAASKAELITNLSMRFEKRAIKLPTYEQCPTLVNECESYEYSVSDQGRVSTSAPSGMHDDHVVSLALAVWAVDSAPDFTVYDFDEETGLISRAP